MKDLISYKLKYRTKEAIPDCKISIASFVRIEK